ncbi:MAG: hypothetical protein ACYDA8_05125 [Deferrisomatales bacterium]
MAGRLGLGPAPVVRGLGDLMERLATSRRGDRNFVAVVSKVNRALDEALPARVADALRLRALGRGPAVYGVHLTGARLRFGA